MSEIKDVLHLAREAVNIAWREGAEGDTFSSSVTQAFALTSIAGSLYVIARVVADMDEVEEMYKDYPPKKEENECESRWVEKGKFMCGQCGYVNLLYPANHKTTGFKGLKIDDRDIPLSDPTEEI